MTKRYFGLSAALLLMFGLQASYAGATDVSDNQGYLVVSVGPALKDFPVGFVLDYASDDGKIRNEVAWAGLSFTRNDFDNGNGERGIVYVVALPPGQYFFHRVAENDGNFVYWWRIHAPFTITAGHVTYAGDFSFVAQQGRGWFGLPRPQGGFVRVSDESSRDIPIAVQKAKIPALANYPLDRLTLETTTLGLPPFCMMTQPDPPTPGTVVPICPATAAK